MSSLRSLSPALLSISAALALVACGGSDVPSEPVGADDEGSSGGEIVVAALPTQIDPYTTTSRSDWMVAASVCEGIFSNDSSTGIHEGLAESYEFDEETGTYLITLREGITFHSGELLTAEDVVASLNRYAEADAGEIFNSLVDTIEATGELEVTITTPRPTGAIPALLATPDTGAYIQSQQHLEENPEELDGLDCTGPYELEEFQADTSAQIARFDDYISRTEDADGAAGEKVAHADSIRFEPLNEANAVNQLRTKEVDVVPQFLSMDQYSVYDSDPALQPEVAENAGFSLLQFNHRSGPMTELALRQAVINAVDPEEIAEQQLGGVDYFTEESSLFPQESEWHSTAGGEIWEARDPSEAEQLLSEADYDDTPIRILYRPTSDNYGPLLEQQLEDAGFTVELEAVDAATFGSTRTDDSAWDIFLAGGTAYSDPLTVVFLNDDFPGWWTTEQKSSLVEEVTYAATDEERKDAWDELQEHIWEDAAFAKLGHEPRLTVLSEDIGGFEPSQGTVQGFYNVWIEE